MRFDVFIARFMFDVLCIKYPSFFRYSTTSIWLLYVFSSIPSTSICKYKEKCHLTLSAKCI